MKIEKISGIILCSLIVTTFLFGFIGSRIQGHAKTIMQSDPERSAEMIELKRVGVRLVGIYERLLYVVVVAIVLFLLLSAYKTYQNLKR